MATLFVGSLFPYLISFVFAYVAFYFLNKKSKNKVRDFNGYESASIKEALKSTDTEPEIQFSKNREDDDGENEVKHVIYDFSKLPDSQMIDRSRDFYELMNCRRTIRSFSPDTVPLTVIENVIKTAGTSPSGAHTEPWTFVVVSNADLKSKIREIVENEEELNYKKRMGDKWVRDLKKFKTGWVKPYLEIAPYLIVIFKQAFSMDKNGQRKEHYYNEISVSVSTGILLTAIQNAGLTALTSTPLNAGPALRNLLRRPTNEKVLLLIAVGYPAQDCTVPDLHRKSLSDIMIHFD